jgi:hypothetical protein
MSAKGQKRTHGVQQRGSLFDHLVGEAEQSGRHFNVERLGGFGIDGHVKFSKPACIGTRCKLDGNGRALPRPAGLPPRLVLPQGHWDGSGHNAHDESQPHSHQQPELLDWPVVVRPARAA